MRHTFAKNNDVDWVVGEVRSSKKYANVNEGVIRRIAALELAKRRDTKEAIHATRNKLHQVGAAYQSAMRYQLWLDELRSAHSDGDLRRTCGRIMAAHSSSRERLPYLDTFYRDVFERLPPVNSVLDIACGLNPLAIPWMNLAPNARYIACDMYSDLAAFLREAMTLMPVRGEALDADVIGSLPAAEVDVALLLKAIPCLEQIESNAAALVLDELRARHVIVSFPTKTLSGRNVGMAANYSAHFESLCAGRLRIASRHDFDNELVFVAERA